MTRSQFLLLQLNLTSDATSRPIDRQRRLVDVVEAEELDELPPDALIEARREFQRTRDQLERYRPIALSAQR